MTAPTRRPVLPAGPRLAARADAERQERRRLRLRRTCAVALALVPVLLLAWVLLASPLLSVHRVQVTGAGRLTPDALQAAAGVPRGVPLARVDTAAVRARVAALPEVRRVRVVRSWPGTVRLEVTERRPVAAGREADGSWVLVDGAGVRFGRSASPPDGLPQLQASDPAPAVAVLAELPPALLGQVGVAQLLSASSVVLRLRDGRTVVWGPPGDTARKAAVVAALLPRPGATIDVTTPGVAVVR